MMELAEGTPTNCELSCGTTASNLTVSGMAAFSRPLVSVVNNKA
jgi:hypothetical protein